MVVGGTAAAGAVFLASEGVAAVVAGYAAHRRHARIHGVAGKRQPRGRGRLLGEAAAVGVGTHEGVDVHGAGACVLAGSE